jgi:hypothetical protein
MPAAASIIIFQGKQRSNFMVKLFIFLFIPIVYLLNVTVIHYSLGAFFMGRVDPEYFYMYNGVVLGAGNLSLQYFFHPGTPLHFLIAISARIIDVFQPGDYMKNFVNDPEKYIHAANLLLTAIVSIILFITGLLTKRYTTSYLSGIAMQLLPFGSAALLSLQGRVFADAMLVIPLLFTGLMVIRHIFRENSADGTRKEIVIFGLITGFGIACKLTFLPVILVPMVMLKMSLKQRAGLLLYTGLFFAVFAYPVIFNPGDFWQWAYGKFSQVGQSGEGQVIYSNLSGVFDNLTSLLKSNNELFAAALLSLLVSLLFSFKFLRDRSLPNIRIRRAIFALNLMLVFSVILTLKHFKLYYFAPFSVYKYLLLILTLYLLLSYRRISGSGLLRSLITSVFVILMMFSISGQVKELRGMIRGNEARKSNLQNNYEMLHSLVRPDRPIILTGPYYGAPFIEYAHHAGYVMTDNMRGFYTAYLREKYPDVYHYLAWTDKFENWNEFVDISQILDQVDTSFYVYIGRENKADQQEIEKRILKYLDENSVSKRILAEDITSDEKLIEITINNKN